jgi:hypothetical protein
LDQIFPLPDFVKQFSLILRILLKDADQEGHEGSDRKRKKDEAKEERARKK